MIIMMDPQTAYFFKKFYRNIIKWWFVVYNPVAKKVWPSKEEEEEALRKEEEELAALAEEETADAALEELLSNETLFEEDTQPSIEDDSYNATTGSFSGLYGQGPVDDETQAMLDAIMNKSSSQSSIDSILNTSGITPATDVTLPPEQDEIIKEANDIYQRLLREAKEDEDRKKEEIEAAKRAATT